MNEIEQNGGIRDIQFGARKGMGTSEALTYTVLGINASLAKDGVCHGVFGDISKAFDRVDPLLLACKMLKKGINEVLVRWIFMFLVDRKMRVKVGTDVSDWYSVDSGIPQGTVLGPLLWLIWIDDCPIDCQGSMELQRDPESGCLFVDDIFLFSRGSERRQVQDLNDRLSKLYAWSNDWGVDFSTSKTKHMIFTSGKKRKQTTHHLSFGGDTLGKVTQYKYLGVLFTCNLKFDTHVNELVLPKVRRVAGYVRHLLAKFQTGRCTFLRILWLSKIQSIIEYGSAVWSSYVNKHTLQALDTFQVEYFRKAMGLPKKTSGLGLLCDISVMRTSLRLERERVKLRAKLDLKLVPAVVLRQLAVYESVRVKKVIRFRGNNRPESVRLRDIYIQDNTHNVFIPRKETRVGYIRSLNEPYHRSTYGQ